MRKYAQQHAIQFVNFSAERGYKVSCAKTQMMETNVTYLGVQITHRSKRLSSDQVQGILQLPPYDLKTTASFPGANWVL